MIRFSFLTATLLLLMAFPRLIDRQDVPPGWRARLAFLALVGMAASASVLLAAALFPEVLVSGVPEVWASCTTAVRAILTRPIGRAPSILAGLALAVILGRFAWSLTRNLRASRRARVKWGEPRWRLRGGEPVYVLPLADPEAYSVGAVRGHVVISAGLLDILDEDERRGVLLHEEAHLQRKHQPLLIVARAALAALAPLPPARAAFQVFEQAIEEAADEYAATRLGDPAAVASGVSKAALAGLASPVGALSLGAGPDVPGRVRRLLSPPEVPPWVPGACLLAAILLIGLLTAVQAIGGLALVAAVHHVLPLGTAAYCPARPWPSLAAGAFPPAR